MARQILVGLTLVWFLSACTKQPPQAPSATLRVLCGSSMAEPTKKLADQFEQGSGIRTELTLGGCETLLPQIELGAPADLFIGHSPFEDRLKENGLRQDPVVILGVIRPSVVTAMGNPKRLQSLKDLARDDVRVGLPDARYSTCGQMFEQAATQAQLLDAIHARTVYTARTHQELATALVTGNVDVVVVWNFIAAMQRDKFEVVPVDVPFPTASVFACLVKQPQSPEPARRFLDFLATDAAKKTFLDMGYSDQPSGPSPAEAGASSSPTVLRMYCAAGVQQPVDELAGRFTRQHPDVRFESVYQGSGTLLAQIAFSKEGDLYVAGDELYMDQAREKGLLDSSKRMAVFTPVLAVPKDNPKAISSFQDLAKEGVRLGLGDEKAAAVGKVARELLERQNVWPAAQKTVVVTTGTVNELAIQASVGTLDAAIIWDATAHQFADRLTVVAQGDDASRVGVPIAVLKFAKHPDQAKAFVDFTVSSEAAAVFEKHGFHVSGSPAVP